MTATTHALVGAVLGTAVWVLVPEAGTLPVPAAALGGLFSSFDLCAGHRGTLHFPVYFSTFTVPVVAVVVLNPTTTTLVVALFLAAVAFHSASDVPDDGLELKPWLDIPERAIYDHRNGQWFAPKRLTRYDGTPEDLALTLVSATPPILAFGGLAEVLIIGVVAVSDAYVLPRKPAVAIAETAVAAMPDHVVDLIPEWFIHNFR